MSTRIDTYKHLDKDTAMKVVLPMEQIARECVALNYGAHRLLSALAHALRDHNAKRASEWKTRYPDEEYGPSELADGI